MTFLAEQLPPPQELVELPEDSVGLLLLRLQHEHQQALLSRSILGNGSFWVDHFGEGGTERNFLRAMVEAWEWLLTKGLAALPGLGLRRLVPDTQLLRRRAAGEPLRMLASDYDVAHTTLARFLARPEIKRQLRQTVQELRAERQARTVRRRQAATRAEMAPPRQPPRRRRAASASRRS